MKFNLIFVFTVTIVCVAFTGLSRADDEPENATTVSVTESSTVVSANVTTVDPDRFRNAIKSGVNALTKRILRFVIQNEDFTRSNVTPQCIRHMMKMLVGLKQLKLWALQMLDASGKIPNGLFSGTTTTFGDYEECIRLSVNKGEFRGKYCLVEVFPKFEDVLPITAEFRDARGHNPMLEGLLKDLDNPKVQGLAALRTSTCVPSSCSKEDIQVFATQIMKAANIGWRIHINSCEAEEPVVFDNLEIAVICLLVFLGALVAAGSLIDLFLKVTTEDESYKEDSALLIRILLCFSAYSNIIRLLTEDETEENIKVFHVLKTMAMFWTILVHTYGVFFISRVGGSLINLTEFLKEGTFQFILQGNYGIEAFFFISAVLLVRGYKRNDGPMVLFVQLFRRLWRLTPPFMLVIAVSFLVHHFGSGPLWKESMYYFVDNCRTNWWTNLLYFNNYLKSENMCLFWTWYIAADTHLYIIGLIILFIAHRMPKIRYLIFAATLVTSIIILVVNNVMYDIAATAILAAFKGPDGFLSYITYGYFATHVHGIPTALGLLIGYIMLSRSKFEISLTVNVIGWLASIAFVCLVVFGPYEWTYRGDPPNIAVSTLYICACRIVWPLSLGWIALSLSSGKSDVFTKISGWPMFYTVDKLNYTAYLVHPLVMLMYLGNSKYIQHTGHPTLVFLYLAVLLAAYGTGFLFHIVIEAPFMQLDKLIWSSRRMKSWSTNSNGTMAHQNGTHDHNFPKYNGSELDDITNEKPKMDP